MNHPTGVNAPVDEPTDELNEATRWLCARALVERPWAVDAFEELCVPRRRSVAAAPGIDLPALARHAAWAVRHEARTLGAVLVAHLTAVLLAVASLVQAANDAAWEPFAAGAVTALVGGYLWLAARTTRRLERARAVLDTPHVVRPHVLDDDSLAIRRSTAANEGDLLVYDDSAPDPLGPPSAFPGFAHLASEDVHASVDVMQPVTVPQPPSPIVGAALLHDVAGRLSGNGHRSVALERCDARVVAHVAVSDLYVHPDVVDARTGFALDTAPDGFVAQVANTPERHARAFVRAAAVGHDGHLATTVHLLVEPTPTILHMNVVAHVRGPLATRTALGVPQTRSACRARAATSLDTLRSAVPFVAAPDWLGLAMLRRMSRRTAPGRRPDPGDTFRAAQSLGAKGREPRVHLRYNDDLAWTRQVTHLLHQLFEHTRQRVEQYGLEVDDDQYRAARDSAIKEVISSLRTQLAPSVETRDG